MRFFRFLLLAGVVGGGILYFLHHYEIAGWDDLKIRSRNSPTSDPNQPVPVHHEQDLVRIATFNIEIFGDKKADQPEVMEVLARIVRQFDVVAIQEIRSQRDDILPRFIEVINEPGRHYDYVISRRLGRTNSTDQYAFVYDRASVEIDLSQLYVVSDPHDLLHRPPFYASFRVRGPDTRDAFTFTLINVHTDPDEAAAELNALDDVFRLVRDDRRGEDDIILLGDLNADDRHLGELGAMRDMTWAVSGVPTNTRQTKQYDNILWNRVATSEFTGRVGIFDFMREYNLTQAEADKISDHLPVWAEFSIYEGGRRARVAER